MKDVRRPEQINFKTYPILPTVYADSLSYQELLYKVLHTINEVVDLSNITKDEVNELYEFIHNSGLSEIVDKILNEWYTTGRLAEIINEFLFTEINNQMKDDEVYSRESTGYGVLVGLEVMAQENPDMSVMVKSGIAHTYVGKRYIQPQDQRISIPPANAQYGRFDVIYITPEGVLSHLSGTPSATPIKPTVPEGSIILAYVYVNNLVVYILQPNIEAVANGKVTLPELVEMFKVLETDVYNLGLDVGVHKERLDGHDDKFVELEQKDTEIEQNVTTLENNFNDSVQSIEEDITSIDLRVTEQEQKIADLELQVGEDLQETLAKVNQFGSYNREATGYGVISGLKVEPQATPNMSVMVQNGSAHSWDGYRYNQPVYETVIIEPSDGVYPRIDVIYITPDAKLAVGKGIPASVPVPVTPVNGIVLAEVYVSQVATKITASDITDKRVFKNTIDKLNHEIGLIEERIETTEDEIIENSKSIIYLSNKKWGVKADGVTDDTEAFESVLQYATDNGCKIIVPKGTIKITRPITIKYYEKDGIPLTIPRLSMSIEGVGGVSGGILRSYGSVIKAYNIPDKKAAIELVGQNNGLTTSVEISNLEINLDQDSCGELSFCLKIGDSWIFTLRRVRFSGFNSVMLRCGTGEEANSYANMSCKFDQCIFLTRRYVGWDGQTLTEKNRFGFAVANERMFFSNAYPAYMSDNITFDTCFIGGTTFNYAVNSVYTNCMWYTPGGFKPEIDIVNDTRFNREYLVAEKIDCSIGFWNAGGSATLINPYFEDVRKCMYMYSMFGQNNITVVMNPFFLGTLNVIPTIDGIQQSCVYAIKTERGLGSYPSLRVIDGIYSRGNVGFSEGFLINYGIRELVIQNVAGVTKDDIIDNGSRCRDVKFKHNYYDKNLILEWDGTASSGLFTLDSSDIKEYTFKNDYILAKVELIAETTLTEAHSLNFKVNGEDSMVINGFGNTYANYDYIEYVQGTNSQSFTIEDFSYKLPSINADWDWARKYYFKKGDTLQMLMGVVNYPSDDAEVKVKLRLHFRG